MPNPERNWATQSENLGKGDAARRLQEFQSRNDRQRGFVGEDITQEAICSFLQPYITLVEGATPENDFSTLRAAGYSFTEGVFKIVQLEDRYKHKITMPQGFNGGFSVGFVWRLAKGAETIDELRLLAVQNDETHFGSILFSFMDAKVDRYFVPTYEKEMFGYGLKEMTATAIRTHFANK